MAVAALAATIGVVVFLGRWRRGRATAALLQSSPGEDA